MLNFNKNSFEFYSDYVDKELYKSRFTLSKVPGFTKLTFISNINKSLYWFPSASGNLSVDKNNKLRGFKRFSKNSTYNFDGFKFLSSFGVYLNSKFSIDVPHIFETSLFKNYASLMNDVSRKQELRKNTQDVRMYSVDK